ncbi:protein of unknown function [Tenacibaculum sp. 190130A14a]|uniref:Uncharacterized protein n=1 Tax=Tenacibaculum polynesiense TaxID=3137857 RepID=A0ABM9PF41_9FLAO
MQQKIINKAFKKIKKKAKKEEGVSLTFTKTSEYLSQLLEDDYNVRFGDKSLRKAYKNSSEIKKPEVLKALCQFLGYESYEDYVNQHPTDKKSQLQIKLFLEFKHQF